MSPLSSVWWIEILIESRKSNYPSVIWHRQFIWLGLAHFNLELLRLYFPIYCSQRPPFRPPFQPPSHLTSSLPPTFPTLLYDNATKVLWDFYKPTWYFSYWYAFPIFSRKSTMWFVFLEYYISGTNPLTDKSKCQFSFVWLNIKHCREFKFMFSYSFLFIIYRGKKDITFFVL